MTKRTVSAAAIGLPNQHSKLMAWGQALLPFEDPLRSEKLYSKKLRIHPITSDTMEPTLYRGDFVLCMPVTQYHGEGIYLVDYGTYTEIYRVQNVGGKMMIFHDHPAHRAHPQYIDLAAFNETVVAYVVAHVKVTDDMRLREAVGELA